MDLIAEALVQGAAAGASATTTTAVTDAYAGLRSGVRHLPQRGSGTNTTPVAGDIDGAAGDQADEHANVGPDELIAAVEADPDHTREALQKTLSAAGAGQDPELVAAARGVLELADPEGTWLGKYHVEVRDSTGVQVGDGNTMTVDLVGRHSRQR